MWGDKLQALGLTLVTTENPISTTVVSTIHGAKSHSRRSNSIGKERSIEVSLKSPSQSEITHPTGLRDQ